MVRPLPTVRFTLPLGLDKTVPVVDGAAIMVLEVDPGSSPVRAELWVGDSFKGARYFPTSARQGDTLTFPVLGSELP